MAMKFRTLGSTLVALCTIGLGADVLHAKDKPQVPFSASYAGTVTFGTESNSLDGSGRSTQLGQGIDHATVVVTGFDPNTGCIPNTQTHTLTAANGDTLTITNSDLACPTGEAGQFHGTGDWEVTGGTGRFSGATGGGTIDGHIDFFGAQYTLKLSGTISA